MIDDNDINERLVDTDIIDQTESYDISLRPKRISEFIGQPQVQKNLLWKKKVKTLLLVILYL